MSTEAADFDQDIDEGLTDDDILELQRRAFHGNDDSELKLPWRDKEYREEPESGSGEKPELHEMEFYDSPDTDLTIYKRGDYYTFYFEDYGDHGAFTRLGGSLERLEEVVDELESQSGGYNQFEDAINEIYDTKPGYGGLGSFSMIEDLVTGFPGEYLDDLEAFLEKAKE